MKHLSLLARTAESICDGDLVDRQVRGNGNWNLLPTQVSIRYVCVWGGGYHSKVDFSRKSSGDCIRLRENNDAPFQRHKDFFVFWGHMA